MWDDPSEILVPRGPGLGASRYGMKRLTMYPAGIPCHPALWTRLLGNGLHWARGPVTQRGSEPTLVAFGKLPGHAWDFRRIVPKAG